MLPIVPWAPLCYASSVLFDAVILIFSLIKIKANIASPVGYVVYRDSLLYFFATALTNIVVLTIQALGPSFYLVKPAVIPFSTLIVTTMASRVFLNLKLFNQRQERAQQGLPLSGSSYQLSSDQRAPDNLALHSIPVYPRPPDIKNSHVGTFSTSSSMPINVTRETYVAV